MSETQQKRIGIFGGTFDPVHIGHLQIAENAAETMRLDEVIFIPAYAPPHKQHREYNASERLEMLELAISDHPGFSIDTREMESQERNYTVRTMEAIMQDHPDGTFYFILGEDSLMQIRSWYMWETFLSMVELIVCPRPEIAGDLQTQVDGLNAEGYHVHIAQGPTLDVSSTLIRDRIASGQSVDYLLPGKVLEYIRTHGLYQEPELRIDEVFLQGVEAQSLDFLNEEPYASMLQRLQDTLKKKRLKHVLRVVQTALFLAERHGEDKTKAGLAALLHDCAKNNEKKYFRALLQAGILREEDWRSSPTYHARLGAFVAKAFFGAEDPEILSAIASHTTGRVGMSRLDKIIFLADAIEPHRDFEGVMDLRKLSLENLDEAMLEGMDSSLRYLLDTRSLIETASIESRNDMIRTSRRTKNTQAGETHDLEVH